MVGRERCACACVWVRAMCIAAASSSTRLARVVDEAHASQSTFSVIPPLGLGAAAAAAAVRTLSFAPMWGEHWVSECRWPNPDKKYVTDFLNAPFKSHQSNIHLNFWIQSRVPLPYRCVVQPGRLVFRTVYYGTTQWTTYARTPTAHALLGPRVWHEWMMRSVCNGNGNGAASQIRQ